VSNRGGLVVVWLVLKDTGDPPCGSSSGQRHIVIDCRAKDDNPIDVVPQILSSPITSVGFSCCFWHYSTPLFVSIQPYAPEDEDEEDEDDELELELELAN
jgi:hypothetical protein